MGGLVVVCTEEYQAQKLKCDQTKGHEVHRITFRQYIPLSVCVCAGAVQHSLQHDGSYFIPVYCVCPHCSLHGSLLPAPSGFLPTRVCGFVGRFAHRHTKKIIAKRSPQNLVDTGKPTVNFGWVMTKKVTLQCRWIAEISSLESHTSVLKKLSDRLNVEKPTVHHREPPDRF